MRYFNYFIIISILFLFAIYMDCSNMSDPVSGDGSQTGNGAAIAGKLYNPGGSPAVNAKVTFFTVDHNPMIGLGKALAVVDSTVTDKHGKYFIDSIDEGYYNILAESDSGVSYYDSVLVQEDTTTNIVADTLKEPGTIRGVVRIGDNNSTNISIVVLGTDKWATPVDSTGHFSIENMPEGTYHVRFISNLEDYDTLYMDIAFISGVDSTIGDTLNLPLNKLILTAYPDISTYSKATLEITLITNGDKIYYTTDGSDPDTNNSSHLYIGPLTISGDVTVKAIAIGKSFKPSTIEGSWTYTKHLLYASLNADPGSTIYNDSTLEVTLTSEEGNSIYYTTDGSQPDTSDATQLYEGPIIISGDVTLRAIAFGPDYLATEKSWVYDCELGTALLTADPADTAYSTNSLEVTLSTNAERIYYTTDGSNPDTNDAGQLYSEPVYISGDTVILRAIAVGAGYIPVQGSWVYIRSLPPGYASIDIDPSITIYNDLTLEVTLTSEEGNRIYYTTDGSTPDTTDSSQLYEGPITISGDVTLRAIAFGPGYLPTSDTWVYDCELPYASLTADPGNTDTIYFNDSLEVTLSTNAERIYYTTDGSTPDTSDAEQLYSDPVYISGDTVILRAIAVGAGYIPVQGSWIYIRSLTSNYASLNADPGSTIYNDSTLEVTLTSEEGNSIYYTTDGSEPDTNNISQLYEEPITISGDVTLRAIAIGPDYLAIEKSWVYDCELN